MLYDPKWNESLVKDFYEFAKQKDPNERFYYGDARNCAVGQFFASRGISYEETIRNWVKWRHPIEPYAVGAGTFGRIVEQMRHGLEPEPKRSALWNWDVIQRAFWE